MPAPPAPPRSAPAPRGAAGRRRTRLQKLALVGFGVLLVASVELGLRLLGWGGRAPLLLPLATVGSGAGSRPGYYELNPEAVDLFFSDAVTPQRGGHQREIVVLPKPPDVLRVVVLGESTIEGFPHPRNLTSSRFLEAMLRRALPDRQVEVLNFGVAGVASFPVRKLAEATLATCEPDLLVVYAGHNEFYGAAGMASVQAMGRRPALMQLTYLGRQLGIADALAALVAPRRAASAAEARRHLIEVMAAEGEIAPGGDLHHAARHSLRANLRAIVHAARAHRVPVILCTVASNERDLEPVASTLADLPARARPGWEERYREACGEARRDGPQSGGPGPGALAGAAALVREAPRHAGAHFCLARLQERSGRLDEAAEHYRLARDCDAMPWRAARDKNEVIRRLAASERLPLADVELAFAAAATPHSPGWSLFEDHLHPSLRGQALLASTVLGAIAAARLVPADAATSARAGDWRALARELGAHPLERYLVAHKMALLFRVPPIADHNQRAARRFAALVAEIERRADPIEQQAIRRWRAASTQAGLTLPISYFAGAAALRSGAARRATGYLEAAVRNAYRLSDERCAAQLLLALSRRLAAEHGPGPTAELRNYVEEARYVAQLPGQPTALQARALAGLLWLAGKRAEAARFEALATGLAARAPAWTAAFARELPALDVLEALLRRSPGAADRRAEGS